MTKTTWTWLVLAVIYAAFFSWYTSFGGPLTSEEIDRFMELLAERNPDSQPGDVARIRGFMEEDTGDDFVMLNVIDMYETPLQIEGVSPQESSDDVLDKYMAYMYPALFSRACHPVLFGSAAADAMDLMNAPGMDNWTRGAGMRYRSRRDLLEIATNPSFSGSHDFKIAAMEKTIAYPLDPWFHLGDPRILLALILALVGSLVSWRLAGARVNKGATS